MVAWYLYLQSRYAWVQFKQLLKVLHICCNTDVIGVLLIHPCSPLSATSHGYISVKYLTAVLQYH